MSFALLAASSSCGRELPSETPLSIDSSAEPEPQPKTAQKLEAAKPPTPAPAELPSKATTPEVSIASVVSADDRSDADKALDEQRKPEQLLEFFAVAPGQRVAEIGAGGGYTTELLARIVGEQGIVYGQNSPFILKRFAEEPWSQRLEKPEMKRVKRLDTEFDAPFPSEVKDLDLVLNILFYHDTVWLKTDRAKMNRAIYAALRSGGIYGIVDHSAKPGSGTSVAQTLHRIDENLVREEVEQAGFRFVQSADFLANPSDARDWNASPKAAGERRGESDRFVLKFVKP